MSIHNKIVETAITFDDVLLIPSYSEVLPNQVSLKSRISDKITLNVPIVSAAMDTVTEADLAIAIARVGGLGFIHKNMPIPEQAAQVNRVKRSENGMIADPVTLSKDHTLAEAKELMAKYKISGLPVVDTDNKLIGIITNRDVKYQENLSAKVEELMTKENLITSDKSTNLEQAKEILLKNRIEKLPIVDSENHLVGLITIKDIDNQLEYPQANKDQNGRLIVGAGVGVGDDTMTRVAALVEAGVDIIAVDSAHGHSKGVLDKITEIRNAFPDLDIVGGNIVTADAAEALIKAGANVLKVGVGPGSICTTRVVAGVGVPQLSAIYNVYEKAKEYNVKVQRVDGENRYRIVDPFSQALAESGEEVGEPDEYLFFTINPKNNGVAFDSYNTGYLTEEGSDILGFSSLDYLGVDDVDSKYDPTSHKVTLNVYYYGDGLIGQKESVLTVPDDFKLILEDE